MELSRLSITGELDVFTTPIVVWEEIANAHGIEVDWKEDEEEKAGYTQRLLRTIKYSPVKIQTQLTPQDFANLYLYITAGKTREFKDNSYVIKELQYIHNFPHITKAKGEPGDSVPEGSRACIAMKHCNELKIPLMRETTLEEMFFGITIWREHPKVLARFVEICMKFGNRAYEFDKGILRVLYLINTTLKMPDYNALNVAHQQMVTIDKKSDVCYKSNPEDLAQLICFAARRYQVNITKFKYPLLVYAKLVENQTEGIFKYLENILDEDLPCIYSEDQLAYMIRIMGLIPESQDVGALFAQISNFFLTVDTFYPISHLIVQPTVKTTSIDHTSLSELRKEDLLAYGTINRIKHVITFDELANTLEHNGTYNNFLDTNDRRRSGDFDESVIKRMRYLSEQCGHIRLATIISHIDNKNNEDAKTWHSIRDTYKKSSDEGKRNIDKMLRMMIDLGMYMRGWKDVKDSLPVSSAPINSEEHKTDENVWKTILAIQKLESEDISTKPILDLPLYRYNHDKGKFCKPPGEDSCKTVRQRIELVKKGQRPGVSSDSCIRMSSNYIIGSAFYALQFIGLPVAFSITMLKYTT